MHNIVPNKFTLMGVIENWTEHLYSVLYVDYKNLSQHPGIFSFIYF